MIKILFIVAFTASLTAKTIFIDDSKISKKLPSGFYVQPITIKSKHERCTLDVYITMRPLRVDRIDKGSCIKQKNSKGMEIYCTKPHKKVCKTRNEVTDVAWDLDRDQFV